MAACANDGCDEYVPMERMKCLPCTKLAVQAWVQEKEEPKPKPMAVKKRGYYRR